MNCLQHIDNKKIENFVKMRCCPHATLTIVADSEQRNYVNVFTNTSITLHITNFDCIDLNSHKDYSQLWRKFVVFELDGCPQPEEGPYLGDQYIQELHDHLEQNTIVGPTL